MRVHTYRKLEVFIDRWLSGMIDLLIIESKPGLGKSHLVREKLREIKHMAVNSHSTPLSTYKNLYYNRGKLVWFDDVDHLLLNKTSLALLKQVCESSEVKKVSYFTTSDLIGNVPQEFVTTSSVLVTCNALDNNNIHLQAIKDRGFYIQFMPTKKEIIKKLQEVTMNYPLLEQKEKEQVLNLIESNAQNIKNLTLRSLIKGFQLFRYYKFKGIDWREDLLKELGLNEKLVQINKLLIRHNSDIERLKEWKWSRQSFYTYKKLVEV